MENTNHNVRVVSINQVRGSHTYHLAQQDLSVFGQLDITSAANQHLDGSLGAEIRENNFHQTIVTVDVQLKGLATTGNLRFGVNERNSRASRPKRTKYSVSVLSIPHFRPHQLYSRVFDALAPEETERLLLRG